MRLPLALSRAIRRRDSRDGRNRFVSDSPTAPTGQTSVVRRTSRAVARVLDTSSTEAGSRALVAVGPSLGGGR